MAKGNRQSFTSNVTTKIQPLVTTAIHRDVLINDLAASVVFGQDVALPQTATATNITVDFTGKDRVDLTRTGGALNITLSGIDDGETKFLLITKTAGQAVTFVGVTDVTPIKANANALNLVLYEIVRKSSSYFAKAWVENVKTATETIEGVLEIATAAEANAISALDKIITPGRIPVASQTQKGIIEIATSAEVDAGSIGNLAVIALELKRKYDALVAYADALVAALDTDLDASEALAFTGVPNSILTVKALAGHKWHKILSITGNVSNSGGNEGTAMLVKRINGYTTPGYNVEFPICSKDNLGETGTGYVDGNGDIYIIPMHSSPTGWVFNISIIMG
jgi:hypothetical protein